MALTNFFKSSTPTTALNAAGAWIGGSVPNSAAARAVWDTSAGTLVSVALGGSLTWGQLRVLPGSISTTFSIAAAAGATLTLTPSDPEAANVGIDLSQATRSFQIASSLALGRDQTWLLGDSGGVGRIITTSGAISGAYSLAITGPGQWTPSATNSFGGVGKTVTISGGAVAVPGVAGSLGNANNELIVGVGGSLDFNANSLTPSQTRFRVSGTGNYDYTTVANNYYGALLVDQPWGATKTVTVEGDNAVIGFFTPTTVFTFKLSGAVNDFIELNTGSVAPYSARLSNTTNDFYAPGGLRISSLNVGTKASQNTEYDIGATDAVAGAGTSESAVFGDIRNQIRVMPSGYISSGVVSGNTRTVYRNVSFDGDVSDTAIGFGSVGGGTGVLAFAGNVQFSNIGGRVLATAPGNQTLSFRKNITGSGALQITGAQNPVVGFDSAETNAFTNWTGSLTVANRGTIRYGNGYATLTNALFTIGATSEPSILEVKLAQNVTLNHSSYSFADDVLFRNTTSGYTIDLGMGPVTGTDQTVFIAATGTTVKMPGNITSQLIFGKTGTGNAGTFVVSGTNTRLNAAGSTIEWVNGNLYLNSTRALGNGSAVDDAFVIQSTPGTLDNTSGSAITLANGGVKQLNTDFSWAGSNDLSLGTGTTTWSGSRIITFTSGGGTGTLTIPAATTPTATSTWNIGNGTAGAKQRLSLNGANATLAASGLVTAGYFRINNAAGLGSVSVNTVWTVSSGAALELVATTPAQNKEVIITGPGPNTDGALRSVSGTSTYVGYISVPVQSLASPTRIQADAGTFTLSAASITTLVITATGTPLDFTALGSTARLNQRRVLPNKVSNIRINNGGLGVVELSAANLHTGGTTCEGGTTLVTNPQATSTGTVQVNAAATIESTVQSVFGTLSLGSSNTTRAILRFAA